MRFRTDLNERCSPFGQFGWPAKIALGGIIGAIVYSIIGAVIHLLIIGLIKR